MPGEPYKERIPYPYAVTSVGRGCRPPPSWLICSVRWRSARRSCRQPMVAR